MAQYHAEQWPHFAPGLTKLFYAERDDKGQFRQIDFRNIRSCFLEKNLYTIIKDHVPTDIVETDFYGVLDNDLAELTKQIHAYVKQGVAPKFPKDAIENLRLLIYYMMIRSPEWMPQADPVTIGQELAQKLIEANVSDTGRAGERLKKIVSGDKVATKQAGRDINVRVRVSVPSEKVQNELRRFSMTLFKPERTSFVITGRGVLNHANGTKGGLANPQSEFWLPIGPKLALAMVPITNPARIYLLPEAIARRNNEISVKTTNAVASHSLRHLCSLLNQDYRTVRDSIKARHKLSYDPV